MPVERTQNAQWQDGSQQNQGANEELVNYLAAKLMLANECQVKMGEMAAKKAETQEVKDLAETLKKEHKELNNRLKEAMPRLETVASLSKSGSNQERGQKGAYQARRPNIDEQNAAGRSSDQFLNGAAQQLLDITRNAAEENHRAVTEMLGEKQGKDFDRCFLATEIGAHQWMLAELKAIQGIDQQQFTSLVKETEQKVEGHLKKAKELAKKMEEDRGSDNS